MSYDRWVYTLFLAIDANRRLMRKGVSSETADPSLGPGWAYFVNQADYTSHLARFITDLEEVTVFQESAIYAQY
jgi:hypothetical protein